jgi:hypothetical protein
MTLIEQQHRTSGRARRKHSKQGKRKRLRQQHEQHKHEPLTLDAPLTSLSDDQCLTFLEWCRLNRISERTGRRILASGTGPPVIQLSTKRIGVTVGANRLWQASRTKAGTGSICGGGGYG